jgi:hypothetical protein
LQETRQEATAASAKSRLPEAEGAPGARSAFSEGPRSSITLLPLELVNAADKLNVRSDFGFQLVEIRDPLSFQIYLILFSTFSLLIDVATRHEQSRPQGSACSKSALDVEKGQVLIVPPSAVHSRRMTRSKDFTKCSSHSQYIRRQDLSTFRCKPGQE